MHPNVSAYRLPTVRQSYLLSGKATYCQASYLLSGMHPNVAAYFAPNNRIQTTYCQAKLPTVRQAFSRYETCTQQPHTLHPNVSADLHPTTAYMHPTDP